MRPELLLLALLASPGTQRAPEDLEALMKRLEKVETFRAVFVETKTMGLLAEPLRTEGELIYRDPGELARVVSRPRASRVLVTEKALTTITGDRVERLDLGPRPEARALVTALLSLLRGDLEALQVSFRVSYEEGEAEAWTLTLEPRAERVGALVKRIELGGRGEDVERYVVREASGDVSETKLREVRVDAPLGDAAAWLERP